MEYENQKLEEFNKYLDGKKVAIIGMGVSNIPLLDYLYNINSKVTVFNDKILSDELMKKINKYRFEVEIGNKDKLVECDLIFRAPSCMPNSDDLIKANEKGAIVTSEIEKVIELAPCKIIGVTGTEGKTTTSSIIYQIIKEAGYKCFLGGNIGTPLFDKIKDMTPNDIVVLELSSFQLMDMKVSPNISVVTNIYPDHLNIHKSYEEYQNAKKNIFLNQDEKGIVVLNKDNDITNSFENDTKGNTIFFSSKQKLSNGYIYDDNDGIIKFCKNGECIPLLNKNDIKLRGIHNYENICAALAATSSLVKTEDQIRAIKNFTGVEHRLEFVRELNNVKYYNDSIGTSPASTIAGLNAFDENIVLIAGGSDKGLDYKEVGETIAKKVGTLILTGPTAPKIEEATSIADKEKNVKIFHCDDLKEAILKSKEISKNGDIVLLSPASASFDAFKNFMERGNKFKEIVKSL